MALSTKRVIAQNTVYLYLRGIFCLFLGLYISRALLQTLGVNDFGLYGVVGGIVGFISFLNMAMSSASSRYITYELAKGNLDSQKKVYTAVFVVHLCIACFTILCAETVGLWYVCNKLIVPEERMMAAHWVYQMSILVAVINITQVPYNALITAHEKMGFISLLGGISDFLRLVVVISLFWITTDRLIIYAILIFLVNLFTAIGYRVYCKMRFPECHFVYVKNRQLFKDILSFASFTFFTSFANVARQQGSVLLINRFFGVAVNASGNIATMVAGNVYSFTINVVTAFRPQIVKNYANQDIVSLQSNIILCMKYAVAMYSLIAIPIFLEMNYVLKLWLVKVPEHSVEFCKITLLGSIIGLLNYIVIIAIQATSRVKKNSIHISSLGLVSIFLIYVLFRFGMSANWAFLVYTFTECAIFAVALSNLKQVIPQIRITNIILKLSKLVTIMFCSTVVCSLIQHLVISESFARLMIVTVLYGACFGILFYRLMLNRETRLILKTNVLHILKIKT